MSESGRSYFPREGEFDFGFMVVHPSEVLKPREVSQGAHCHRSSLPSPPHHATVPKLPMASHPHAACTPAPPPGLITAPSLPQHCTFIPESFYSCSQPRLCHQRHGGLLSVLLSSYIHTTPVSYICQHGQLSPCLTFQDSQPLQPSEFTETDSKQWEGFLTDSHFFLHIVSGSSMLTNIILNLTISDTHGLCIKTTCFCGHFFFILSYNIQTIK